MYNFYYYKSHMRVMGVLLWKQEHTLKVLKGEKVEKDLYFSQRIKSGIEKSQLAIKRRGTHLDKGGDYFNSDYCCCDCLDGLHY